MEYYNNILCVEGGWLYKGITHAEFLAGMPEKGGVMSKPIYDKLCRIRKYSNEPILKVLRPGCRNTPALVAYESIPERFKALIIAKYGNPYKTTPVDQFESLIKNDMEAFDFFSDHRKPDGSLLKPQKIAEYTANASILNACHEIITKRNPKNKTLGGKTAFSWEKLSSMVNSLNKERYPHSLPENFRALERKYKAYKEERYMSLIHKNEGNSHSLKIDDDKKTAMFRELFSDHRNLDNTQVLMLYNMVAEPMGWDKITVGTVQNWRTKLAVDTHAGRHGVTSHRNNIAMQVKRTAPTHPLYFWTMDGWDAELLFQKETRNNKNQKVITYHNRPTVVIVLDPCTKYPVGYAIGTHESPELIKSALRNAVNHVKELFGARFKPHQLQTDNYAVSALKYMYESVSDKHTPARVKNAKSKVIEPYFAHINKKYCHLMANWSGYGVTASKDHQPNDEYLNKIRHTFPTEQECYSQIESIINMERAAKRAEYMDAWAKMPVEDRLTLSDEMYLYLFGETTGYTNRLEGKGIVPTIGGREYAYDSFDAQFRNYGYVDWMIKYDPADLTQVLAVNAKKINNKAEEIGTLRFILTQKYVQPMALKERKLGDAPQLAAINNFNKELEAQITERRALSTHTVKELFESNPQLNNTLSKLVLVDSRGQHKDTRNALRDTQTVKSLPVNEPLPIAKADDYDEIIDDPLEFIRNNF